MDFSSAGTCFHQPLVGRVLIHPRQPIGSPSYGGVGDSDFGEGAEANEVYTLNLNVILLSQENLSTNHFSQLVHSKKELLEYSSIC